MPKMAQNGQKLPKKINFSKDGNRRTHPPKMEIKLILKINLRKDGNRRTPFPPKVEDFHLFLFEGCPYSIMIKTLKYVLGYYTIMRLVGVSTLT